MRTFPRFQGLRRRSILVIVVVVLMLSLLPTTAFASGGGRFRPRQFAPQQQRFVPQKHQFRRQPARMDRCVTTYRVRRGDTLSEIARHFRVSIRVLSNTNNIRNPNRIFAGMTLCIPN